MAALEVKNLTKEFEGADRVVAVDGVNLTVDEGEAVALVGPSGSGKTTLLAMIGALLTPTEGQINVRGTEIHKLTGGESAKYRRTSVGYIFQSNNLIPYLTARENLLLVSSIGGSDRRQAGRRADQLLEELGLSERADALATTLSGGERQRVAIGRALFNEPEIILADEPTASLDATRGKTVVESLMQEARSRNKVAIMVTHDLEMARLADRVIKLRDGKVMDQG